MGIDFEKFGRTIYEAFKGTTEKEPEDQKEENTTEVLKGDNKEKVTEVDQEPKIDPRDLKIKELENLLKERDGQIIALKELTSTVQQKDEPIELSLEEIIKRGEF